MGVLLKSFAGLLLFLAATSLSNAASITYALSQQLDGGVGSVTGTIVTDGKTGALARTDFLDWTVLISNGTSSFLLTNSTAPNVSVVGSDLLGTSTQLLFNFSNDNGALFVIADRSSMNFLCLANYFADTVCDGPGELVQIGRLGVGNSFAGTQVLGTAVPVQEPSTLPMLSAGIALIGFYTKISTRAIVRPALVLRHPTVL